MEFQGNSKKANVRLPRSSKPRSNRWNTHWRYLHPQTVQELLVRIEEASTSNSPVALRRVASALASIEACLEFPLGELNTPGFEMWIFLWRLNHRLSAPYPSSESKGRFNAQGLEFLIRIEGESLLTVLLAAKHLHQWRFALSLHITSQVLQERLLEAEKKSMAQPTRAE